MFIIPTSNALMMSSVHKIQFDPNFISGTRWIIA